MSKKRRLAGIGKTGSLITAGHLHGRTPAEDTVADLQRRLTQVEAERDELKAQQGDPVADDTLASLRQELAHAEARLAEQEAALEQQLDHARADGASLHGPCELRLLQPEDFAPRPMDSDEIREADIVEMVGMIDEQGLLQWPIVDRQNRPLSGRRRSLALQRLAAERPERYRELFPDGIPVIAMSEVDWDEDPLRADQEMLLMQHTQRRRDKPAVRDAKIRQLAERMQADPKAKWRGGRTGPGEYHALKRLTQLFGVSSKIVQRALAERDDQADDSAANAYAAAHLALDRQVASCEKQLARLPEPPPDLDAWRKYNQALLTWLDRQRQSASS